MRPNTPGGNQACAACKYQRRRCAPDCALAPHFPSNRASDFLNAHKLFGVRNIVRTLKKLPTFEEKKHAITSMIYQANARVSDPVGGCHRIITQLKTQIEFYELQLNLVRQQIAFHQRLTSHNLQDSTPLNVYDDVQLQQHEEPSIVHVDYQHPHNYNSFDDVVASHHLKDSPPLNIYDSAQLHPIGYVEQQQQQQQEEPAIVKIESEELSSSCLGENDSQLSPSSKQHFAVDESELDKIDSAVFEDSKEVVQCSDKMVFKEDHKPIQHGQEHNQKDASQFTFKNGKEVDDRKILK
ncbi:hypothetical protein MANES_03G048400v8 [Manihot esculenta]|uniref:Uncharacterized protein n=1 Tax=Manihot esculenta TaxID=3983 RepID=A0ACB7HWL9_MANES|nr:hypothetical protein MANES_03G048400v8 [Manihot esculenta]